MASDFGVTMPSFVRYQSDIDPNLFVEEPNTSEGLLTLQARVLESQIANPTDPRFFIGSCVVVERDAVGP